MQQFRTAIGRDVIIREGDPTSTHDLLRVSAQRATSVCLMMTAVDEEESEYSNGRISNSASIRCLLALRSLVRVVDVDWVSHRHKSKQNENGPSISETIPTIHVYILFFKLISILDD